MTKSALAFITNSANKNSIAALAGLIEAQSSLDGLSLRFLKSGGHLALRLGRTLAGYERTIVAYSFCTPRRAQVRQEMLQLRSLTAEAGSSIYWIAGGPHPSGAPEDTLRMGFDYAVTGEAEETFLALLSRLLSDGDPSEVRGVATLQGGEYLYTGRARLVRDLNEYPPFAPQHHRYGPIEITRGCPFACRFCQTSRLLGGSPRHRSPEIVAMWSERALADGVPFMRFVTPNALAYGSSDGREPDLSALEELLTRVGRVMGKEHVYLGSFPSEIRPEMVTDEAVRLIKRLAGNTNISMGAQSGSQRILDAMQRGHTVDDVYRACHIVLRHGLMPNVDVIFGLPGETRDDRDLTIQLVERLTDLGARIRTHAFIPLAGTPLAGEEPGVIDEQTDRLLGRLARDRQQHGSRRSRPHPTCPQLQENPSTTRHDATKGGRTSQEAGECSRYPI